MQVGLAVFDDNVLKRVGHIFAVIGGLFQQLIDLFELHDVDRILFVREQSLTAFANDIIGDVFNPVDLDTMFDDLIVRVQRLECNFRLFDEATMLRQTSITTGGMGSMS